MITDRRTGLIQQLREGLPALLVLFAWDVIVVLLFQVAHRPWMDQPSLPTSLIGSVLVLFLSVRNNAAYARWWEARTLWGAVTNNARSFSRQMAALIGGAPDLTRAMVAYAHALRGALQSVDVTADLQRLLPPDLAACIQGRRNKPNAILYEIGVSLRHLAEERAVHPAALAAVDRILSDISNAQGGLERIRNTPLAIQFSALPGVLVRAFCLVLPLSMVQELGWITPLGSTVVGFLFLALDEIGLDLEDPFTDSPHALPMLTMTRAIEIDLLQSLGEPAPEPIRVTEGVLP
jgi:putative membrane protein